MLLHVGLMVVVLFVQAVEDVHVTYEDQQRINNFATNMRRMTELKNELEAKKVGPMLSQGAQLN